MENDVKHEINTFKAVNFSRYMFNNWKVASFGKQLGILDLIEEKEAAIWLNKDGALCYRFSEDEPIVTTKNYKHAEIVFSSFRYSCNFS